jgi:hypothetical protein
VQTFLLLFSKRSASLVRAKPVAKVGHARSSRYRKSSKTAANAACLASRVFAVAGRLRGAATGLPAAGRVDFAG